MCDDKPKWTKEVVVALACYVKLEEAHKLRACHLVALEDPSVIAHDDGSVTVHEDGTVSTSTNVEAQVEAEAQVEEEVAREPTEDPAPAPASKKNIQDFFHSGNPNISWTPI